MTFAEEAVSFSCHGERLIGILARPDCPMQTGVVVIVGGPQYRVGSHRQFVHLSRSLAQAGYPVLRFDVRGMGDSQGGTLDFEESAADIAQAVNTLQRCVPAVNRIALWGLCDGASAALLYCLDTLDRRVVSLCLVNPWVRNDTSLARARVKHYYRQRLLQTDFWGKLLRGGIRFKALGELVRSVWLALRKRSTERQGRLTFQQRMAMAWVNFSGHIFLLLSEDDYIAKEFLEHAASDDVWVKALQHSKLERHDEPAADHTFSSAVLRARVAELTLRYSLYPVRDNV